MAVRETKAIKSSFEYQHHLSLRVGISSSIIHILKAADFSKNFQALLENYDKENSIFNCAFTLKERFHCLFPCSSFSFSSFEEILKKLGYIRSSNCVRNSPCVNQICLRRQLPRCNNLTRFADN